MARCGATWSGISKNTLVGAAQQAHRIALKSPHYNAIANSHRDRMRLLVASSPLRTNKQFTETEKYASLRCAKRNAAEFISGDHYHSSSSEGQNPWHEASGMHGKLQGVAWHEWHFLRAVYPSQQLPARWPGLSSDVK